MQTWWIRHGIPYRIKDGDRQLLVALNDVDARTDEARLSVHEDGKWVVASTCAPATSARWPTRSGRSPR